MGGGIDRLSDLRIKAFLRQSRAGTAPTKKLADGRGLYITVTPAGTPVWRIKYRHGGKEGVYSCGVYPKVSLQQARADCEAVRALLKDGRDPVKAKLIARAENVAASGSTFGGATAEWLAKQKLEWSAVHFEKSAQALERDVLPYLGRLPTAEITPPMVANVIKRIVRRGANETAAKILNNVRGIFELAQVQDGSRVRENPALPAGAVLAQSKAHVPRPALLAFPPLGDLLRRADSASLSPAVRMCHRLIAYTASRLNNAVEAQWTEFNLDGDTPSWTVPRDKMKVSKGRPHDHKVLLGPTIAAELQTWKLITGGQGFLFPSPRGKNATITKFTLCRLYARTLGMDKAPKNEKHGVHGWRASFATLSREHGFAREVVELTIDHIHDNEVARAYDRGQRLDERRKLMFWWDGQLTAAQHGGDVAVIPMHSKKGVA